MSTDGRRLTPLKYSTKVYSGGKVRNGYTSDRNGRNGYTSISLRQVKLTSPGVRGGVLIPVRRVAARGYPQNPPELTPAEVNFTWRTKGGSEALVAYQGGVRSQECGPPLAYVKLTSAGVSSGGFWGLPLAAMRRTGIRTPPPLRQVKLTSPGVRGSTYSRCGRCGLTYSRCGLSLLSRPW